MAATGWVRLRLAWLFSRRVGLALLWMLAIAGIAIGVNLAGIHIVGSIDGWERWLHAHATHFFVWRLLLYAATAYAWRCVRKRLQQREPGLETRRRLLRIEVAAVVTLVLLEGSQWLRVT